MLRVFSQLIEFFSRLWLVNVPTYVVTEIPEVSVCVTYLLSYILVQNVGFLWAFLVNASFAVACQVASFLPFQDGMDTHKLVGSFYLVYSSVRVITYFAATMGRFAILCLQNFSGIEKLLLLERDYVVKFYHIFFGMIFALELALIGSDVCCASWFPMRSTVCHPQGLLLLTQRHPANRRLLYCLVAAVVMSLWQCVMHQFPRWNKSMSDVPSGVRVFFQVLIASLSMSTTISLLFLFVPVAPSLVIVHDLVMCVLLLGWTLMLYLFVPLLIASSGDEWIRHTSTKSLKRLFLILCMSQGFFIVAYVTYRTFNSGFISGQLEFVVACFCLPSFWVILAMLAKSLSQSSITLAAVGLPATAFLSVKLSRVALLGGDGSAVLMLLHAYGKLIQFFGYDIEAAFESHDHDEYTDFPSKPRKNSVIEVVAAVEAEDKAAEEIQGTPKRKLPRRSSEPELRSPRLQSDGKELNERGQAHSTLVSAGIPPSIVDHWFVRMCRVTLKAWGRFVRALAVTDSILSAIVRVGVAIAGSISIVLAVIGVCSVLQRNGNYYMKLLSYHHLPDSNEVRFDHIISNATIRLMGPHDKTHLKPISPRYAACEMRWAGYDGEPLFGSTHGRDRAQGLTVLDLAILSEVAYIDDDSESFIETNKIMNDLFPDLGMTVNIAPRLNTEGPKFLEVTSSILNITVIAVRGTDPGRFYDFLEDVALYSESASYHLLTLVFPTMRLWSGPTISQMIQWLCDLNRFFGLQPESLYYSPLVQRVRDIELSGSPGESCMLFENGSGQCDAGSTSRSKRKLLLTGHSLGGGLARIVGTMTGVPSVSISPPGLAMSFKKYNFLAEDLSDSLAVSTPGGRISSVVNSISEEDLHHESFAVISEYDWITQVDGQVGMVQKIQCDKPEASHKNACHMLEGTICHLLNHCGDVRNRFRSCDFDYDLAPVKPWLMRYLSEHKLFLVPLLLLFPFAFFVAIVPDII